MQSTDLIPLDGDVAKITRRAEEFKDLHESLQRNLQTYLTLTMDALAGVHQKTKMSAMADSTRQMVRFSPMAFRLSANRHATLADLDCSPEEVEILDGLRWNTEIPHVAGCLFVLG